MAKAEGELEGRGGGKNAVGVAKAVVACQRPWGRGKGRGGAQAEGAWTGPLGRGQGSGGETKAKVKAWLRSWGVANVVGAWPSP